MTIREQIIKQFDKEYVEGYYSQLKQCIELDWEKFPIRSDSVELENRIDNWFKGIINSLYYRPNKLVLVFKGEHGIGKKRFFNGLLPVPHICQYYEKANVYLYYNLLFRIEFTKRILNIPNEENFTVSLGEYPCDKRLASYCSTTHKWNFPQRKNFIIVPVKNINFELFNSIDKELLWIEIFNKFKPEL